jgi:hypothetical protein
MIGINDLVKVKSLDKNGMVISEHSDGKWWVRLDYGKPYERDEIISENDLIIRKGNENRLFSEGGGVMDDNTFAIVLLQNGFKEQRGAYGVRSFYHPIYRYHATLDDKLKKVIVINEDIDVVYEGYSIKGLIDSLKEYDVEND